MEITEETAMIFGLVNRCPFGQGTTERPMREIRRLTLKGRYSSIRSLPDGDHREIINLHRNCLGSRIKAEESEAHDFTIRRRSDPDEGTGSAE